MSEQREMVLVADRVTLLAFRPLGVHCVPIELITESADPNSRRQLLQTHTAGAKLVVVSHEARLQLGDEITAVTNPGGLPLVVTIPGAMGSKGDKGQRIRNLVERAIGADLFKDDEK